MKPQIPWLRVFVEGVVIVGSILLIAGCGGADPANVDEARVLQPDELCSDFSDAAIATFEDANLETLVRQQLSVGPQEDLTCGLISSLALLSGNSGGVASLIGIQNLTGLSDLRLASNSLTDISPLGGLTGLTSLMLLENQISDLTSLSNLTGLTGLFLDENLITDLGALSGLTGITLLHLDQNSITNVTALGALADLNRLRLNDNSSLSDIQPLLDNSGLGAGDTVYLRGTAVSCADVLELEGNGVTVVSDCP